MNPNKALWETGDFSRIAETMRLSGEEIVKSLGIGKGDKVLDLGCGDGTTAIPSAKAGADVLGVDISSILIAAANKRVSRLGLTNCKFTEGDACNLDGIADNSFDYVVTIFGAMFAPRPFDAAKEMVRVTKPGGKIVMGNWIPNDPSFASQVLKASSSYAPPPPEGFISPMTWGVESNVIERFTWAGIPEEKISFLRDTYHFHFEGTPSEYLEMFGTYYAPTIGAFAAATKSGKADDMRRDLDEIFNRVNQSQEQNRTYIPATFLRVTVSV